MASVNMTGLVEAEPASRNDMFISAPKKAAMPRQRADDQADADRHLAEGDQPGEPRLVVAVDQEVDEVAIPLEA